MAEDKKYVTVSDMLKDGAIMKCYSLTHLISVNPGYGIDRVRFSAVKLGTSGKEKIDVWISLKNMYRLCEEIDSGVAARKLEADKDNPYPSAYKYVTGTDGSKGLCIGGGTRGIRIQCRDGKKYMMVGGIQIDDLIYMSFLFKLTSGLIAIQPGTYYAKLLDAYMNGNASRNVYFNASEDGDYIPPAQDSTQEGSADNIIPISTDKFVQSTETETATSSKLSATPSIYHVTTKGEVVAEKSHYKVDVFCSDDNQKYVLYFTEQHIGNFREQLPSLCKMSKTQDVRINIEAVCFSANKLEFYGLEKKKAVG